MTPRDRVEGIFITLGDIFTPLAESTAAKLAVKRMLAAGEEQRPRDEFSDITYFGDGHHGAPDMAVKTTSHLWANYYLSLYAEHTGEIVRVSVEISTQSDPATYGRRVNRPVFEDHVDIPDDISPVQFMIEFSKGSVSQYLFTMTAIKKNNDYPHIN